MEEFCRTCGKTVNANHCINIFAPVSRRVLHCVRTITNCWVENAAGFPIYLCEECQTMVNKVHSFRKRCAKIESFLVKRKAKLCSNNDISAVTVEQAKFSDPLEIEEPELNLVDIKVEPTLLDCNQIDNEVSNQLPGDIDEISESFFEDHSDSDGYRDISYDDEPVMETSAVLQPEPEVLSKSPAEKGISHRKTKMGSRRYTMRVGKRTMYIKLTNDTQPKRIVDRERQWASARPCICEHCGRQFKDGSNLNVHLLRHTGTKNYECKICNEKCYTLHLLRRHQLKHTEGPYECTFCGLHYSTNSSRVRHEREACKKGRAPQSKTELIKRGERTFHCDVCDLWFLRAGNLTQHINSSNHITNARNTSKKSQVKQKKSQNMVTRS